MTRPRMLRIGAMHGAALASTVYEREAKRVDPDTLLCMFADADPSLNKSATQWLVRCYLAGGFKLEDLAKARITLSDFTRHRRRLPVTERDLGRYKTLASLWKAIRPFAMAQNTEPATGREARRHEREQARAQSEILFEGEDGFTVAVPMTKTAARWWGRGTRWCTSAERNNAFIGYHTKGPLIIIVLPDGTKLQLFASIGDAQFMDEDDSLVEPKFVEDRWSHLEPVVRWGAVQCGYLLKYVPEAARDRETCLKSVKKYGFALEFVDPTLRGREICLEAVRKNGTALEFVPPELRDREMCEAALEQNGQAMNFVPKGLQDRGAHLIAVRQDGWRLPLVPESMRDREICIEAVKHCAWTLQFVPETLRDRTLYLEAVAHNGKALEYVPPAILDTEISLNAVGSYGRALEFVPQELRSREVCLEAVKQTGRALHYVPDELRDREMCLEAVKQEGYALRYVPNGLRDRALCLEVKARNAGRAAEYIEYLPEDVKDRAICLESVKQSGRTLKYVPPELRDLQICQTAVDQDCYSALKFVPDTLLAEINFGAKDANPQEKQWRDEILDELRSNLSRSTKGKKPESLAPAV